jgi:hypothetical protein
MGLRRVAAIASFERQGADNSGPVQAIALLSKYRVLKLAPDAPVGGVEQGETYGICDFTKYRCNRTRRPLVRSLPRDSVARSGATSYRHRYRNLKL